MDPIELESWVRKYVIKAMAGGSTPHPKHKSLTGWGISAIQISDIYISMGCTLNIDIK